MSKSCESGYRFDPRETGSYPKDSKPDKSQASLIRELFCKHLYERNIYRGIILYLATRIGGWAAHIRVSDLS